MKKYKALIFLLSAVFFLTSCSLPYKESPISTSDNLQLHFIDVGQGDCTLISCGGRNILVDAGSAQYGSDVYEYLLSLGIKSLDAFIGTHPHEDHLGGAAAVLSEIKTEKVYLNGETSNSYFFDRFVDILLEEKITPFIPHTDAIYIFSPLRIKFLSPERNYGNGNDNSLVFTVEYENVKILFTGDAERAVESELVKNDKNIKADILKVSHHGSRYASSVEFLNRVRPSVAVISSGNGNSYGHPHKETIERLDKCGVKVLRTDKSGTIVLSTDGENIYNAEGEAYDKSNKNENIIQTYTGNRKSKVFHCETCPNLPSKENSIIFENRESAILAGYLPCRNCNP